MNLKNLLVFAATIAVSIAGNAQTYTGTLSCGQSLIPPARPGFEAPTELTVKNGTAQMKRSSDKYEELLEGRLSGQRINLEGAGRTFVGGQTWTTKLQGTVDGTTFKGKGEIYTSKGERFRDCEVVAVNATKPSAQIAPVPVLQKPVEVVKPAPAPVAPKPMEAPQNIASFNCQKAESRIEKMICSNPETARLDVNLSAAYKQALANSQNQEELKTAQLTWLATVRDRSVSLEDLNNAYLARIKAIEVGKVDVKSQEPVTTPAAVEAAKPEIIEKPQEQQPPPLVVEAALPAVTTQTSAELTKSLEKAPSAADSSSRVDDQSYAKYWITLALLLLLNAGYAVYQHRASALMLYQDYTDGAFAGAAPLLALMAFGLLKVYGIKTETAIIVSLLMFLLPAWYVVKSTYRNNHSVWNFLVSITAKITIVGAFYALMAVYVISLFDSKNRRKGERRDSFDARLRREGIQTVGQMVATTAGFIGLSMWISKRGEFISVSEYCYPTKTDNAEVNTSLISGASRSSNIPTQTVPVVETTKIEPPIVMAATPKSVEVSKPSQVDSRKFQITISGLREGESSELIKTKLEGLLKATPAQIDRLLASPGHVLKRDLPHEKAVIYQQALINAGANCTLQEQQAELASLDVDLPTVSGTPLNAITPKTAEESTTAVEPSSAQVDKKLFEGDVSLLLSKLNIKNGDAFITPEKLVYSGDGDKVETVFKADIETVEEAKHGFAKKVLVKLVNGETVAFQPANHVGFLEAMQVLVGIRHVGQLTPAPELSKVKNWSAWLAAFGPLIASNLMALIWGLPPYWSWIKVIIMTFVLIFWASLFLLIDARVLQSQGYNLNSLGIASPQSPMYLFSRAKAFNQKPIYAYVWCVAAGLALLSFYS